MIMIIPGRSVHGNIYVFMFMMLGSEDISFAGGRPCSLLIIDRSTLLRLISLGSGDTYFLGRSAPFLPLAISSILMYLIYIYGVCGG